MKYIAALLLVVCFSCSNQKKLLKETNSSNQTISLTRTGCYGTCPMYDLKIKANGVVEYTGRAHVKNIGNYKGTISKESADKLFEKINNYNWSEYPNAYPIDNVDFPQFIITYNSSSIQKEVRANSNASEELIQLSKELDTILKAINLEQTND